MGNKRTRVAVGLSGGVDSSVAAALLKKAGHDVIGISMEIFDGTVPWKQSGSHACYGPDEKDDMERAYSVCKKLHVPFYVIDLKGEFRRHVIHYFTDEYLGGRTPNPCVVCNQRLKFDFLLERAKEAGLDFDYFATGHYAQIAKCAERYMLKKAEDLSKDQTYFLYTLTPDQLSKTLFPLGSYTKQHVRDMGRSFGLETADCPESQDFVAGGDYSLLFDGEDIKKGDFVDEEGNALGNHRGIIHYTVGQRRGLGIASHRPLYVLKIDAARNRVVVGQKKNLYSKGFIATHLNLVGVDRLDGPHKLKVKIRLNHGEADATLFPHEGDKAKVVFDEPQMSITPGQSAVFYSSDMVFGGGIIEEAL